MYFTHLCFSIFFSKGIFCVKQGKTNKEQKKYLLTAACYLLLSLPFCIAVPIVANPV